MSKYVIKVITEVDNGCFVEEYYKGIDVNDNVVLTGEKNNATLLDEEICEDVIDHLTIVFGCDYIPRKFKKIKILERGD